MKEQSNTTNHPDNLDNKDIAKLPSTEHGPEKADTQRRALIIGIDGKIILASRGQGQNHI